MAKHKRIFTGQIFQQWLLDLRSQDAGQEYKPWVGVQDIMSHGLSHRITNWATKCEAHLSNPNSKGIKGKA